MRTPPPRFRRTCRTCGLGLPLDSRGRPRTWCLNCSPKTRHLFRPPPVPDDDDPPAVIEAKLAAAEAHIRATRPYRIDPWAQRPNAPRLDAEAQS